VGQVPRLIISFQIVDVSNENVDLGQLAVPSWFGRLDSWVFYDGNDNGVRDPAKWACPSKRSTCVSATGRLYQSFPTDLEGYVSIR